MVVNALPRVQEPPSPLKTIAEVMSMLLVVIVLPVDVARKVIVPVEVQVVEELSAKLP